MMDRIIQWSVDNRYLVVGIACVFTLLGLYISTDMAIDVFPELTAPTVVVLTEAPGMSAAEVESLVTYPLETALNGAPGTRRVRSASMSGFSIVWTEFGWDEAMATARQTVIERVRLAEAEMPEGVSSPMLAPPTSLMGEIQLVALQSDTLPLEELQNYADTVLRRRLLAVPGIAQVNTVGSGNRQYQLWLKPERLASHGITVSEVADALRENNANISAGFIADRGTEYLVVGRGRLRNLEDIEQVVVTVRGGVPIRVGDVGEARLGAAPVRGTGAANGKPAVLLYIQRQPQANTLALDRQIDQVFAEESARLPEGMTLNAGLMKQADFIRTAVGNVRVAIRHGATLVIVVMALFLFSTRAVIIALSALPVSILAAVMVIYFFGGTINTMTLGGLAIAIGSLMDDAVIDVENTIRRLRLNARLPRAQQRPPLRVVYEASCEIRSAIIFATVIITVVFLPLYTLGGVEGRLLRPLGTAYIVAIVASLLKALTLTPALEGLLLPGSRALKKENEPAIAVGVRSVYAWLLRPALRRPWLASAPVLVMFIAALGALPWMGRAFLPDFSEGALNVIINTLPGTSLEESDAIGARAERMLLDTPEITSVARKTGRGELDEHAQGVEGTELEATYTLEGRKKTAMLDDIRARLSELPGVNFSISGPIAHRIDHMLSGARASIAVRISGDDLRTLRDLAHQTRALLAAIPGVIDLAVEPQTDVPEISVRFDRDRLARNGVSFREAEVTLRAALYGAAPTRIYEGSYTYDLALRLDDAAGEVWASLADLPLRADGGGLVPLGAVATITRESGPNIISREHAQRKILVTCNTSGRDVTSVVTDIRAVVDSLVAEKPGYAVHYGGQFESAAAATRRLLVAGAAVALGVFALLWLAFRNARDAVFVMTSLPLALIGGVAAVSLTGGILSIASIIGFISVFGVAVRNGIMLINHIRHLQLREGVTDFHEAVWRGAIERIIPVLMTSVSTGLALAPLALAYDAPGNEIQSPMAAVIIGGLISATLFNMIVAPALYLQFGRPATLGPLNDSYPEPLPETKERTS